MPDSNINNPNNPYNPVQDIRISNASEITPQRDIVTDLRIEFAEMSRDMVHLAACFQELNAQLSEFMSRQEQRVADIQSTCITRSVKWGEMNRKISDMEIAQRDIYSRIERIEKVHDKDEGGESAVRPYRDYVVYLFMTATAVVLTYLLAVGGIHT